ncbi:Xaa-Pro aminopeptidase [Perkinsela sp. CCAP 1560/4]|nr:Xaa-Pro aminopeptidase [Perkinsela sp. CCAP 1560/4]|eukprot:KNH04500.1 Xaa-Pro aminopeptidase [Perkinsela sp. CCAP 1560/4]
MRVLRPASIQRKCVRYLFQGATPVSREGHQSTNHLEISPGISVNEYDARRQAFFASLPDQCIAILPGAHRQTRTNDILWPLRQDSNFWFLTGFDEAHAIAVFLKNANDKKFVIFCEETDDHAKLWHGPTIGCAAAVEKYRADDAFDRRRFRHQIAALFSDFFRPQRTDRGILLPSGVPLVYANGVDNEIDTFIDKWIANGTGPASRTAAKQFVDGVKMRKSASEQKMLQKSAKITASMFRAAMGVTAPGESEKTLVAAMDFVAQRHGASGFAYVPVVAGGKNALCLHYIRNDARLEPNELVMVDAGADYHYYPTDCTRAWPISGAFTEPQRELYASLLRVQKSLIDKVRPGQRIGEMQSTSEEALLEEMLSLGVIPRTAALSERKSLLQAIYPHGWGHPMGIDIHEDYPSTCTVFREGMMHTVEPGVYIPHDDRRFPEKFRGIGFRIEDNVIVGSTGCGPMITTACIPKELSEIEALVRAGKHSGGQPNLWDF